MPVETYNSLGVMCTCVWSAWRMEPRRTDGQTETGTRGNCMTTTVSLRRLYHVVIFPPPAGRQPPFLVHFHLLPRTSSRRSLPQAATTARSRTDLNGYTTLDDKIREKIISFG